MQLPIPGRFLEDLASSSLYGVGFAWLMATAACASAGSEPALQYPASREPLKATSSDGAACTEANTVDVLHHEVTLSVRLPNDPPVTGKGRVRVRAQRAIAAVVLDAQRLKMLSAKVHGAVARMQQDKERVCIFLPEPIAAGAEALLDLTWEVSRAGAMPQFFDDQVWAGYQAASWMPTRQDAAQRATLALRIKTPSTLRAVASGRLLARVARADGTVEHSFVVERPAPPFLFAFAVGSFEELERRAAFATLRAFGPSASELTDVLTLTEQIYQLLMDRTGSVPPFTDYSQVFVHGDAAQEGAGMSLIGESALADRRKDPSEDWVFAHELAHQWFAWLVPCADFTDFWLNEGFATFFVGIFKEHRFGRFAYEQEVGRWRASSARVHAEGKDAPVSLSATSRMPKRPIRDNELQARGVTYARGALVLHKLREELGEAVFWRGIRTYVKNMAGKDARSEDLRRAMEEASERALSGFFARWVYASAPDL